MKTKPYSTPPGTYDLPFTWAFDASQLVNGTSPQANSIYLLGGYGDFVARRAVGFNRILNPTTGTYRVNGPSRADYLSSDPIFAANSPEFAILNEQLYPETGLIRFDLNNVLLPAAPLTSQIAFQGVRREKGSFQKNPAYKAFPKTFTYQLSANLTQVASAGVAVSAFLPIDDYDFELHEMILFKAPQPEVLVGDGDIGFLGLVGAKQGVQIIILQNLSGLPNQPFNVSVVGSTITFVSGTDNVGIPVIIGPLNSAFAVTLNSIPAIAALVTAKDGGGNFAFAPDIVGPPTLLEPGFTPTNFTFGPPPPLIYSPITDPVCSISVYDSNKVKISNIPILDIFYNGGPTSPYKNGALVPPLWYPKETVLQIDFYSQITSLVDLPTSVQVVLVGKQYIPC